MKIKYFLLFALYLVIGCFTINAICVITKAPVIISYICCMMFGYCLGHWLFDKTMR